MRSNQKLQHGLSLVELMIALAIGLFLMLGATQIFLASLRNQGLNEEIARRQERIRLVKEWLSHDLRQLGYLGCGTRNKQFANSSDGVDLGFSVTNMTDLSDPGARLIGVTGVDGDNLPSSLGNDLSGTDNWQPGDAPDGYPLPDIVTLSSVQPGLRILGNDITGSANLRVVAADSSRQCSGTGNTNSSAPSGLCEGDLLIAADCDQAVLFVGTNITTTNGCGSGITSCTQVVHSRANTGGTGNTASVWQKQVERFGSGAELIRVGAVTYFVGLSELNDEPALMRCELPCTARSQWEELVPGVENLQVWYRLDDDDRFLRADEIVDTSDWQRVSALRIRGVLRSTSTSAEQARLAFNGDSCESPMASGSPTDLLEFTDGRLRTNFCFSVALRNRLN